mmetsp:Transcript_24857/g.52041  ORF Transcript_24857/g.52041 Transcript_24857/m.52041 type:complete len:439 (+) Transcript_24857:82-1398(+)
MMKEEKEFNAAVVTALTVVAATAYLVCRKRNADKSTREIGFPIRYDHPNLPLPIRIIGKLPKAIRAPNLIKSSQPKPPKDAIDVLGKNDPSAPDPYDIVSIEEGKIWRVKYHFLADLEKAAGLEAITGKSFTDANTILANVPPEMKDIVAADLELQKRQLGMTQQERVEKKYLSSQNMLVARLDAKDEESGKEKLLVYNPCRMRPSIMEWLDGVGTVSYIVSGSSAHTNQLCQASEAFPKAKIVCAELAEMKCTAIGMRNADFVYTKKEDLKSLNAALANDGGAELHYVEGDTFTHAALVLVHGHLFECDLIYGRHCKTRMAGTSKEQFEDANRFSSASERSFWYTLIAGTASYTGCSPTYRVMGMDPRSPFCGVLLECPKDDSCSRMAGSLRKVIGLKFDAALMVHGGGDAPAGIPAEEFKKNIDANWNWLDGKPLI